MTTRRKFLHMLAPLALLPVVGPHMLLSERPTSIGWRKPRLIHAYRYKVYLQGGNEGRHGFFGGYNVRTKEDLDAVFRRIIEDHVARGNIVSVMPYEGYWAERPWEGRWYQDATL